MNRFLGLCTGAGWYLEAFGPFLSANVDGSQAMTHKRILYVSFIRAPVTAFEDWSLGPQLQMFRFKSGRHLCFEEFDWSTKEEKLVCQGEL